jgi:hypothetical protein
VLRRILGRVIRWAVHAEPPSKATPSRLDELEARLDWLHGQVKKLRGRLTGATRWREDDDPARDGNGGGPVTDAPLAVPMGASKQWELAALARTRQEELGRQLKGGG